MEPAKERSYIRLAISKFTGKYKALTTQGAKEPSFDTHDSKMVRIKSYKKVG